MPTFGIRLEASWRVTQLHWGWSGPRTEGTAVHSENECLFSADTAYRGGLALGALCVLGKPCRWDSVTLLGHQGAPCPCAELKPSLRSTACLPALGLLWGERGTLHVAGYVCDARGTPTHAPV